VRWNQELAAEKSACLWGETFEFNNIPAGVYDVRARLEERINPEPMRFVAESSFFRRGCTATFVSEPQVVRVVPGAKAAVKPTISEALMPCYPIPDAERCEAMAPAASDSDRWTDEEK
jgi:hypothetical protein